MEEGLGQPSNPSTLAHRGSRGSGGPVALPAVPEACCRLRPARSAPPSCRSLLPLLRPTPSSFPSPVPAHRCPAPPESTPTGTLVAKFQFFFMYIAMPGCSEGLCEGSNRAFCVKPNCLSPALTIPAPRLLTFPLHKTLGSESRFSQILSLCP